MIRKLLIVIATGMCLVGPSTVIAHAADTVVVVDTPPGDFSTSYSGTLTRSSSSGPAGFLAVYGGLSVLGFALTAISLQRRSRMRAEVPSGSELAYGRRALDDFWAPKPERIPAATAAAGPPLRTGPLPWPRSRDRDARPRTSVGSKSGESVAG